MFVMFFKSRQLFLLLPILPALAWSHQDIIELAALVEPDDFWKKPWLWLVKLINIRLNTYLTFWPLNFYGQNWNRHISS